MLRDWSLKTGRGGVGTTREGGGMLKGGHNKFWGSFYAVA